MRALPPTVVLLAALLASPAFAQPGPPRVELRAPQLAAPPPAPAFPPCVTDDEVRAAQPSQRWAAFRRSAVPIPPLLYLSQDRTFMEALLLYWSSTNVEERTKLRLLIPFVLQACTPRSRTLVTPVYGHRVDAEGKAGFIGSYFFRRDRTAQSDVLFPLFARIVDDQRHTVIGLNTYFHKTAAGAHGGVVPLVFWGSARDGSSYQAVPPLLFARWGDRTSTRVWWATSYYERDPGGWSYSLFPLYFGGRRGARHHQAVLPPLFARWGDGRDESTLVLNTVFSRDTRTRDWSLGIIPLAYATGTGRGDRFMLLSPLVLRFRTPTRATTIVGPAYYHHHPSGHDLGLFPLLLHGAHRDQSSYTVAPALLSWHRRDRRGFSTVALPLLFAHWRDRTTHGLWWATSWYHRDLRGWSLGVAPLLFAGRTGARHHAALLPLFSHWGDGRRERTIVLNTYYGREPGGDYGFSFFPLVFAGRTGPSSYFASPLVLHLSDPLQSTTIIGPAFHHRDPSGYDAGVVPLWFQGRSGARRYFHVPPLLTFDWADEGAGTHRTIAGPFYDWRSRGERHLGVVPLWFQGHTRSWRYVVAPLFPFWYMNDLGRTLVVAGPVYVSRTATDLHVGTIPLFFTGRAGTRHYTFVPPLLLWDWGDDAVPDRMTLLPLGYRYRAPGRLDLGLIPLFFEHRDGPRHVAVAPPLLSARWEDGPRQGLIALGLIYSVRGPEAHHRGVIPLYFGGRRRAAGSYYDLALPPLFMRWGDARSSTLVAGPFYWDREPDGRHFGVFPLYFGGRDPRGAYYDVALPFLVRRGDRCRATIWSLLYYDHREGARRHTGLFPFYLRGRGLDARGGSYDHVLPPLFMRWGDRDERRLVAGLVYDHRTRFARQTHVLPLFYRGRDFQRETYYDVLLPLFARFGDRRQAGLLVLPPLFMHWRSRGAQTTVLLPGYLSTRPGGWDAGLPPLFVAGRDDRDRSSYLAVLPPLYVHWRNPSRSTTWALTYFDQRRPGGRTRALVPIWFEEWEGDRFTRAVTPLFWQWGDAGGRSTLLLPLAYHARRGASSLFLSPLVVSHVDAIRRTHSLVVFPLWWRFRGPDGDTNVGFPLWWDFHAPLKGTRLSILFPLGFRREARAETTTMVLNVLLTHGKGAFAAAWSFHLIPLCEVARYNAEHLKWQVLLGLFGHERQGRRGRWRIFYVWTDPF